MKAALFYGPGDIRIEEIKKPIPGRSEVLVRVKSCAICGTDVRIFKSGHRAITPPHITGHEISGIVEEVGENVKNIKKGDKVAITTEVGCGYCKYCLSGRVNLCNINRRAIGYYYPGGFAEYILIPGEAVLQGNIITLSNDANLDEMSLVEPLACCINAQELVDVKFGDTVLIIGAGPIGCMHVELSKLRGASKVIIANYQSKKRIELARRFNADYYFILNEIDIRKEISKITKDEGIDIVIVACSSPEAQKLALDLVGIRGKICYFGGLPKNKFLDNVDTNIIHYKEARLMGSFSSNRYHSHTAVNLIENKKILASKYITHKFPLDNIVEGINKVMSGDAIKVVINP